MSQHGFEFRDPGEGQTGWDRYATKVPGVTTPERVARTHRDELGAVGWVVFERVDGCPVQGCAAFGDELGVV